MSHAHAQTHGVNRAVSEDPGWSLLRLSAASRVGLALAIVVALWLATLAVIL